MRRAAILISALAFVLVPAARAAPPRVTVQATPSSGAAPLTVTLTASGDVATYHWDLGDGTTADGAVVQHAYPAGRFVAHVTATNATGEASQASVTVTSYGLKLSGPRTAGYGQRARFRGSLQPGLKDRRVVLYRSSTRIGSAKTGRNVEATLEDALAIVDERKKRVPTSELHKMLTEAIAAHPPAPYRGREVRFRGPADAIARSSKWGSCAR